MANPSMWHEVRLYDWTSWIVTPSIRMLSGLTVVSLRMLLFEPPYGPPQSLAGPHSPPRTLTFVDEKTLKLRPLRRSSETLVTVVGLRGLSSGRTSTSVVVMSLSVTYEAHSLTLPFTTTDAANAGWKTTFGPAVLDGSLEIVWLGYVPPATSTTSPGSAAR